MAIDNLFSLEKVNPHQMISEVSRVGLRWRAQDLHLCITLCCVSLLRLNNLWLDYLFLEYVCNQQLFLLCPISSLPDPSVIQAMKPYLPQHHISVHGPLCILLFLVLFTSGSEPVSYSFFRLLWSII